MRRLCFGNRVQYLGASKFQRRMLVLVGLAVFVLLGSQLRFAGGAQAALGGEFVISAKPAVQQRIVDATWHSGTGQFLVAWSEETDPPNDQIRGSLVNLDGSVAGADYAISDGGGGFKGFPQVADISDPLTPTQQLSLAVWVDSRSGDEDIWGSLIAPSGSATQGSNFRIADTGRDFFPRLAYGQTSSGNGVFLVVWHGGGIATGQSQVFGQLVRGATTVSGQNPGQLVGSPFPIPDATAGDVSAPSVAFDPVNDRFLVAWEDDRGGTRAEREIWGQFIDPNGNRSGGNFQISAQPGHELNPQAVYNPEAQEFLVVWERQAVVDVSDDDIHAQRLSAAGTAVGGRIDVAVTAGQEEDLGDVSIDADSGRYVIPMTTGPNRDRVKIEMQLLDRAGRLVGGRQQVATNSTGSKGGSVAVYGSTPVGPGVGAPAVGEVLVAWRDERTATGPGDLGAEDIWGRMVEVEADTDGDGLLDKWETDGYVDINDNGVLDAGDLNFGAFPAADRPRVNHKDLYVEVDWMQVDSDGDGVFCDSLNNNCDPSAPGDHSHGPLPVVGSLPTGTSLDAVVTSFANAPVANPDGSTGITLHIDIGQLGGGGPSPEVPNLDFFAAGPASFEAYKRANFAPNRQRVFRYGVLKHEGSGRGEIWGNDFWSGAQYNTQPLQAVDFMHELGHTLGLRHSGGADRPNCAPNYLSVMNYTFSTTGIPPTLRVDYSSQALNPLVEGALNEGTPMGDGIDHTGDAIDQTIYSAGGRVVGPNAATAGNIGIDWDNDGIPGETGASTSNDINVIPSVGGPIPISCGNPSPGETMPGFDDWANIRYNFRSSPNYDDNVHAFPPEADLDKDFWRAHYGEPGVSVTKTGTAAGIPGDAVSYTVQISNSGPGPARTIVVDDTWPRGLAFTGTNVAPASNTLNADGSRRLRWDFDTLAPGAALTLTLSGTIEFPPAADAVTQAAAITYQNVLGEPKTPLHGSVTTDIQVPKLEATKSATTSVNAGEAITYTVGYQNVGDADAAGVVIKDTLPINVYYNSALDLGAGPRPDTVSSNPDGTTALTWRVGAVPAGSGPRLISYTARPSLLFLGGAAVSNGAALDFTDANGNDYPALSATAGTTITVRAPTRDPQGLGFWRAHPELSGTEIRARIQATDRRFDGADGTTPDGQLSLAEVQAVLVPGGNMDKVLEEQLLGTYLNLADRRINAGTTISSPTTTRLRLGNVRAAALYAIDTLRLPVNSANRTRYSDATRVLDEINNNKNEVY
jgi:uncharacterized repeat protein (TIGR01451 family)